jgi:tetratricopeptide (TPR) repeat protein
MSSSTNSTAAWQAYQAGDLPRAEQLARQLLRNEPANARAVCLLGAVCHARGRRAEALGHYRQAVRLAPDYAEAHNNLGVVLAQEGKAADAADSFREAVRLAPAFAEAHNNLGNALRVLGRHEEAIPSLHEALRLKPGYPDAHHNLGLALLRLERFAEAADCFRQVVDAQPGHVGARHMLAVALLRQEKLDEAAAGFEQVLRLRPDHVEALNDLGYTRRKQGRWGDARECFERALGLKPDHPGAHHNRALLRLLLGDYEGGWAEYEWRLQCPEFTPPSTRIPTWDGSPLAGRTILLHNEQGIGDTLQFVRYAGLVKACGATVLLACPQKLVPLLRGGVGIDRVLAKGEPISAFDVHASLLSLPHLFHTTVANVPAPIPYLSADATLVEHWRRELEPVRAFKVGICWKGSAAYREDVYRSIPLARFAALAAVQGVRLFGLQKGPGTEQLVEVAGNFEVTDLGSRLDETTGAFVETAAVVRNLDLVVTCDSALGHLAGALGAPVWIALPHVPDYRWMLDRPDSPWYPSARLFRQRRPGDWDEVFTRLAAELRSRALR